MSQRSHTLVDRCFADENPDAFTSSLDGLAEHMIRCALRDTEFNISRAAVRLGIHRNVMKRWMRRLDITTSNDPIQGIPLISQKVTR